MEVVLNILKWLNANSGLVSAIVGIITIIAIYRSPIVALRLQKNLEKDDAQKNRKIEIFKTLMATRANPVSNEHVQALNMIDVEFYHDSSITDEWNKYRDHLNSYPQNATDAAHTVWEDKKNEYLTDLLFEMSKSLNYDFDEVQIKKGVYAPLAHAILNAEQALIRQGFVEILSGNKSLNVNITNPAQ